LKIKQFEDLKMQTVQAFHFQIFKLPHFQID